jgi:magnesium-transporting ATPase (P-type)
MNYHFLSISENYQLLNTNKQGLHHSEAEERLSQYGKNVLAENKKASVFFLICNLYVFFFFIFLKYKTIHILDFSEYLLHNKSINSIK